jgi:hypothetical protein
MRQLTNHKSRLDQFYEIGLLSINICLFLVFLCTSPIFGEDKSLLSDGVGEIGLCGGVVATPSTEPPPPFKERAPLVIDVKIGSVIIGTQTEPFNIQSGVNDKLEFEINGGPAFIVVLSPGTSLSAQDIAADLNANGSFSSQADASEGFNGSGTVRVRSFGAVLGSIQLNTISNNAYTELGFTVGYNGPSLNNFERDVIFQAQNEWETLIESTASLPNPYSIEFATFPYNPGSSALGTSHYTFSVPSGVPLHSTIFFNSNVIWYVDITPWEDSEFDSDGFNGPPGYDLLSVVRHEMGHSLGWTGVGTNIFDHLEKTTLTADIDANDTDIPVASTTHFLSAGEIKIDNETIPYTSKSATSFHGATRDAANPASHTSGTEVFSGNIFDRHRLNIGTEYFGAHARHDLHPHELMNPSISQSMRKKISDYPTLSFVGRSQSYDVATRFVDGNHTGTELGSANNPWTTFNQANTIVTGRYVVVIPGTYTELPPSFLAEATNTYMTTRVGSAVVSISESSPQTIISNMTKTPPDSSTLKTTTSLLGKD